MRQPTILLVDDCRELLESLSEILTLGGFRVLQAESGEEGIALFTAHQHEITLVVGEIALQLESGRRMVREIRRISEAVPILIVTGLSSCEATKKIGELNDYYLLLKPFHPEYLSQCIGSIIG